MLQWLWDFFEHVFGLQHVTQNELKNKQKKQKKKKKKKTELRIFEMDS